MSSRGAETGGVRPPVVGTGGVSTDITVTGVASADITDTAAGSGRLAGKVAAITGATSGSGLAIAKLFATEGASVVLLARGESRLKALEDTLGPNVTGIPTDVSDPDSVRAAFSLIAERFGKLDILINNAGIQRPCAIEALGDNEISAQVGTNLLGPIYTSRAAIPLLRAAGGGEIINTSSEATIEVFPFQSMYSVTKAGLEALGRSLNFEYDKEDIRTTTIIQGVALGEGGGALDWDHNPEMTPVMWPRLQAEGTIQRVMGKHGGQKVDDVAEVHLFIVTRPRGQKLDVIRVRSY
jgi:NAD(P)-dependent dehydrogenase (short-subunit alcohol dehydrogenase family)